MKKVFAILAIAGVMVACNNSGEKKAGEVKDTASKMMNNVSDTASKMMDKAVDTMAKKMEEAKPKM